MAQREQAGAGLCRDPETGMPYADIEAFRELRRRAAEGRPLNPKRAKRKRFGTGMSCFVSG